MALEFRIATGSSAPIYRQIVEQVRKAVASGAVGVGEQLPSVRALAELLVVNPNTVARAYAESMREGLVESQAGKGLFVAKRRQLLSDGERQRRLAAAAEVFISEVAFLDFSDDEVLQVLREKWAEHRGEAQGEKG